jgi:hypothetical protein
MCHPVLPSCFRQLGWEAAANEATHAQHRPHSNRPQTNGCSRAAPRVPTVDKLSTCNTATGIERYIRLTVTLGPPRPPQAAGVTHRWPPLCGRCGSARRAAGSADGTHPNQSDSPHCQPFDILTH